jgi:hypothetical protein
MRERNSSRAAFSDINIILLEPVQYGGEFSTQTLSRKNCACGTITFLLIRTTAALDSKLGHANGRFNNHSIT